MCMIWLRLNEDIILSKKRRKKIVTYLKYSLAENDQRGVSKELIWWCWLYLMRIIKHVHEQTVSWRKRQDTKIFSLTYWRWEDKSGRIWRSIVYRCCRARKEKRECECRSFKYICDESDGLEYSFETKLKSKMKRITDSLPPNWTSPYKISSSQLSMRQKILLPNQLFESIKQIIYK